MTPLFTLGNLAGFVNVDFHDFLCPSEVRIVAHELEHLGNSGTGQRHGMVQVFGAKRFLLALEAGLLWAMEF